MQANCSHSFAEETKSGGVGGYGQDMGVCERVDVYTVLYRVWMGGLLRGYLCIQGVCAQDAQQSVSLTAEDTQKDAQ